MEDAITTLVDNVFDRQLLETIIQLIIVGIIILFLKNMIENVVGFVTFLFDPHVSVGSPIEVYGKKGRVKCISPFTVTIENKEEFIRIPFKGWRTSKYSILKDNLELHSEN